MRLVCRSILSHRYSTGLAIGLVAVISPAAHAHPGHAHEVVPAASPWHYWLQPEHAIFSGTLLAIVASLVVLTFSHWQATRRAQRLVPLPVTRRR